MKTFATCCGLFLSRISVFQKMQLSISIVSGLKVSGKEEIMKHELSEAFGDGSISWRAMLNNDEYEVLDFETEEEARAYVKRILWDPLERL
ncbi:hypothetical protein [Metapseudomonas otitidis]|uniref:hypothetical protein n=1 Tax=Metapseudomonas otitidis TaxID=319939 RepID=UPI0013F5BC53|nr:hypothetical protein [Pseudomonas otitidis]